MIKKTNVTAHSFEDEYGFTDFIRIEKEKEVEIVFDVVSKEKDLPGDLKVTTSYTVTNNEIKINYKANSNKNTLCNITNHTYFNLTGNFKNNCLDHIVYINSSKYTNLNEELIATSIDEANQIFNFKNPKLLKTDLFDEYLQKHKAEGYDHCFLLDDVNIDICNAYLYDSVSKRKLELYTTYPSVVMFCCNTPLNYVCSSNNKINKYDAICLEAQYVPNNVNMIDVDKDLLVKNQEYNHTIKFKFKIE